MTVNARAQVSFFWETRMLGNLGSYVAQQFTWRPIGSGSQTDKLRLCQIRRETKNLFLKSSVGVNVGRKTCWQFPHQKSLSNNLCSNHGQPFSLQSSTIHLRLLLSYWAFTKHLRIPDKCNKKHFKSNTPCSSHTISPVKRSQSGQQGRILLVGANAHLFPVLFNCWYSSWRKNRL